MVYHGICWFMIVYESIMTANNFEIKYIPAYTMLTPYMQCMWSCITLHTCIYFVPMIRFQLHPPGWPARKLRTFCCHCFDTRDASSSTMIMFTV